MYNGGSFKYSNLWKFFQRNFRFHDKSSHISDNKLISMSAHQISMLDPSQVGYDMVNRNRKHLTEDKLDALLGVLKTKSDRQKGVHGGKTRKHKKSRKHNKSRKHKKSRKHNKSRKSRK